MDAQKRYTNTNVELKAQGLGNIISSLLGGLPMTSVVVRTTANNAAGAKSKMSAIIHGVLLLVSVLAIPSILNKIPLATLAAVLLLVGYKLANPKTIKDVLENDKIYQFIPFIFGVSTLLIKSLIITINLSATFNGITSLDKRKPKISGSAFTREAKVLFASSDSWSFNTLVIEIIAAIWLCAFISSAVISFFSFIFILLLILKD
jgi:hypothetical protein